MKLNLKQIKILLYVLGVAAVLLAVLLAVLVRHGAAVLLAMLPLAAFFAVYFKLWRCPHCGAHLGRIDEGRSYCPHCGKKLDGLE